MTNKKNVFGNLEEPLAPCGTCRQMLSEFGTGDSMVKITHYFTIYFISYS